jgi:hypothetical protein
MVNLLKKIADCRKEYLASLNPEQCFLLDAPDDVLAFAYRLQDGLLVSCFNLNGKEARPLDLSAIDGLQECKLLLDSCYPYATTLNTVLKPNQALVFKVITIAQLS